MREKTMNKSKVDFSKGPVWKCVVAQAIPLTVAQLVQLLYNVVDRIYLGHMGDGNSLALTGVGLTFPIVTLVMAFAGLFGIGGVPLFFNGKGFGEYRKSRKNHGQLVLPAVTYFSDTDDSGICFLQTDFICIWSK